MFSFCIQSFGFLDWFNSSWMALIQFGSFLASFIFLGLIWDMKAILFTYLSEDLVFTPCCVSPMISSLGWLLEYFQSFGRLVSTSSLDVSLINFFFEFFFHLSLSHLIFLLAYLLKDFHHSIGWLFWLLDSSKTTWMLSSTTKVLLLKTLNALLVVEYLKKNPSSDFG